MTTVKVAVADGQSCALKSDGSISCWGDDGGPPSDSKYQALSLGNSGGCAIDAAGKLHCWGSGDATNDAATDAAEDFSDVSVGKSHACALSITGALRCWGASSLAAAIDVPPGTYDAVVVAEQRMCAIDTSGTLGCWGPAQDQADPPSGKFVALDQDGRDVCGLTKAGKLVCARGDFVADAPPGAFVAVSVGPDATCAVGQHGRLQCWNRLGAVLAPPSPDTFRSLSVASRHGCGVRSDGSVECWGAAINLEGREVLPPSGVFQPQRMERSYHSRKYYNASMPHAIFFYYGVAIHGTSDLARLGGPASHGCVRLSQSNAATLFALVQRNGPSNTRITIN